MREDTKCEYYSNLKKEEEFSFETKATTEELRDKSPVTTEELLETSEKFKVCPYEISMILGKESKVIVTDYYYLFNPRIRDSFLKKTGKELEDAIIIVDEAHNLPNRIKDLASERLSNIMLKRAIAEADNYNNEEVSELLMKMLKVLEGYTAMIEEEAYITMQDFYEKIDMIKNYDEAIELLEDAADKIREEQKQSYIGAIELFLKAWPGSDEGFTRIFSREKGLREEILRLSYKCLDPGIISRQIIEKASSVILMSGTLTPTSMYREILGFEQENTKELTLTSPFPEENRLALIIPRTSTKFTTRNEEQYKEIGNIITKIVNAIPGNSAVFLPSYKLRDDVYKYLTNCEKTIFIERQGLTKQEKEELLENFKQYKNAGAVLLGVITGSFAEGIDLPGDYLKGVVVVGLPLQRPDLETKAMIDYYDKKFSKGWDYGYIFPAFNKTLQSAGRCIRSETDRGVIVFLDERYAWPSYMKLFPESWNLKTTLLYESMIKEFFAKK
jgi:DNA excision repair protein ERCC-2